MNTYLPLTRLTTGVALLAAALIAVAPGANAGERTKTVTGERGGTVEKHISDGHVSSTGTGPKGKSYTKEADRSKSGGSATVTGSDGKSFTRETTREDGTQTSTYTGADGKTKTVTRDLPQKSKP